MELTALAAWRPLLGDCPAQPWFSALAQQVDAAYRVHTVYPPREQIFAAFALTPPEKVRAVILGQDPYHAPGQATGLAFSVSPGTPLPPSLRNILKECRDDVGTSVCENGDLRSWAAQGVFLLNTVLTVEDGRANSHAAFGWQHFTDAALSALSCLPQPVAFVLWGTQAQSKRPLLETAQAPREILASVHPSPLSAYRGFFGSRPFSRVNSFLQAHGEAPIRW
jgi:uracil-DNA glycosylase